MITGNNNQMLGQSGMWLAVGQGRQWGGAGQAVGQGRSRARATAADQPET